MYHAERQACFEDEMGYSQQQKAENHGKILAIAARRFRELGLDGLGVVALMKEAGLTHGGFYSHFASRDDLVAQVLGFAFQEDAERLARAMGRRDGPILARFLDIYLSQAHRDAPGMGCTLAAVAGEASRKDAVVRALFDRRIGTFSRELAKTAGLEQPKIMMVLSAAVGALALSRAVSDKTLSSAILSATKEELLALA